MSPRPLRLQIGRDETQDSKFIDTVDRLRRRRRAEQELAVEHPDLSMRLTHEAIAQSSDDPTKDIDLSLPAKNNTPSVTENFRDSVGLVDLDLDAVHDGLDDNDLFETL